MTSHQCQGYKEKTCKKSKRYLNKRRSSKQIGEPTEESNILLRRTAVPKCDITPAVKGLTDNNSSRHSHLLALQQTK